ncbi:MAG TPA: uroporphyrinogen decarboxylase family protein [Anaerolineaceae bacterium]|nr:uroporphyrinogen decarboxylase family protein [Anaerolineaceae bacterium]HQH84505.1 uroporphyrinogen decarboxylase family protein [Anaerolineaceae bacterium]
MAKSGTQTHRQRLETLLGGGRPDRTPVALWRHFPVDDQAPERLAAAIIAFQKSYDFDLIKVTPASSFCVKDWGAADIWQGSAEGTRAYGPPVIQKPEDWENLRRLSPHEGALKAQLECLKLVMGAFKPHTPVLQTIFSPLAQAKNLAGKEQLIVHLRQCPEAVHAGLRIITQTTIDLISEALKTGMDGIFYAVQHAQYGLLTEAEFMTFGRAYDLPVLATAQSLWLNMGHIHGEQIMFQQITDYPVQILNWHDQHTWPSLKEALSLYPGLVCGGLRQWETLAYGTPEQIWAEARAAQAQTQGKRFILGTGCVTPIIAPHGNLMAVRNSVEAA